MALQRSSTYALACLPALAVAAACDRGPLDTVADTSLDAAVWHEDGKKIAAALPPSVGAFKPVEASEPFWTSYATGPVFGASCTYGGGPQQLVLRVESGNIRVHASTLDTRGGFGSDSGFVTRAVTVHGQPAALRWNATAKIGEVTFLVQRRFLVEARLWPAARDADAVAAAEAVDVSALEALTLDGVTR